MYKRQVTSRREEGGAAATQHGGRTAFREGLSLGGVHYALEAGTLRVGVRRCPENAEEPCALGGAVLPLLHVAGEEFRVIEATEELSEFGAGEALVTLEPAEGVQNPLILGLLKKPEPEPEPEPSS